MVLRKQLMHGTDKPSPSPTIIKSASAALLVLGLWTLPQAISPLVSLIAVIWLKIYLGSAESVPDFIAHSTSQVMASSIGHLLSCVLLLWLAKWVSTSPELITDGFDRIDNHPADDAQEN